MKIPLAVRQRAAQEGKDAAGGTHHRDIKRTVAAVAADVRDAYLNGWTDGRESLRELLRDAKAAIDSELAAMGEAEWKQHPICVSNAKLCDRIVKILKEIES